MRIIKKSDYKQMIWKNGLGTTLEIERHPAEGPFLWRLSLASLKQSSPFSIYPGFDRWLAITEGSAIYLNEYRLRPKHPHHFSGETEIQCKLTESEAQDIGLIYNPKKIQAKMQIKNSINSEELKKENPDKVYIHLIKGQLKIANKNLEEKDTLVLEKTTDLHHPIKSEDSELAILTMSFLEAR